MRFRIVLLIAIVRVISDTFVARCGSGGGKTETVSKTETAILYLQRYGFLHNSTDAISSKNAKQTLRNGLASFQDYYKLPGRGDLNNATLEFMRKPRCGIPDLPNNNAMTDRDGMTWPRKHLTWNFHEANKQILEITNAALALWAANSSLTFERNVRNPDLLLSFREGLHVMIQNRRNEMCPTLLDGPGGALAHAFYPTGKRDHIGEVHIDSTEPWHTLMTPTPANRHNLQYVIVHEIGHALGLRHNDRRDSVMFPVASEDIPYPIRLSAEDVNDIRNLYDYEDAPDRERDENDVGRTPATTTMATRATATTTVAPTTTTEPSTNGGRRGVIDTTAMDLCEIRDVDLVLVLNERIYIAHNRYIWSIDIDGRTFDRPLILTDYVRFLPSNIRRLAAAYQRPTGELVLFANETVYMMSYPSLELTNEWPRSYAAFGIPPNSRINAALNSNTGRSYVIYNDRVVGEIDECSMTITKHYPLQSIFPGIPYDVTSAFRYIDGTLYFIRNRHFFKFNDFTKTVTNAGRFDLSTLGIACPRKELMQQLRDLLNRFARIDAARTQHLEIGGATSA